MLRKRLFVASLCVVISVQSLSADEKAEGAKKNPAISALPRIPVNIHESMQTANFTGAVKQIDARIASGKAIDKAYLLYLKGIALMQLEQLDAATDVFKKIETDHAESRWVSRARFGQAGILVTQRDYVQAGAIYQKEAERLLSAERRDELVSIYLEFADRYFEGVPAADPSRAKQPDYEQALTYYTEALKPRPSVELRQKIEFRIARCQEETGNHGAAIASWDAFLKQYGAEKPAAGKSAAHKTLAEAKFRKGSSQLAANQRAQARRTWQNLLSEPRDKTTEEVAGFLRKAQYRLAHTYGLPSPASVGDLELAVALAEQFLKAHPDDELAPVAELEIAQGQVQHGRHAQAVDRLTSLIENPKYEDADQVPIARRMLGNVYQAQQKYEEAIAAWKAFLENHPTDPQWPSVQKQVVDAEFARGSWARSREKYAEARTLWQTFLNKYPLDRRASGILNNFGRMKYAEGMEKHNKRIKAALQKGDSAQSVSVNKECRTLFEEAIADWRRVVQKYPNSNDASMAAMMIGVTLEDRLGQLKEALEAYRKVRGSQQGEAQKRIAGLTTPQLEIVTERKYRSDEKPRIKLTTRNVEKVSVKVYRVDMSDYFRKMHLATGVENLDIALIDPDEQFDHAVEEFEKYRRQSEDIEIPVDGPGVTAVTVSSDKLEATTMVVVSDLDVIVKSSRNELFLFAENMRTGKAADGVSVLISDGKEVFAQEITGVDGTLQKSWDRLKNVNDLRVFAIHEGHVASTVNGLSGLNFAVGLSARGYLYTDRPAYRAGQLVNIKGVVRWVDNDRFTFKPGEKFRLDIYDARGRVVRTDTVALNKFGTINRNVILPDTAPQGSYRVCLHRSSRGEQDTVGGLSFETTFSVTEYRLEPVQVSVDIKKDVFFRGDKIEGSISLKYYYGTPLAGEQIRYSFGPGGEMINATTDDKGQVRLSLDTQRFSESQPLTLTVQYPSRNLATAKTVYLATRGFEIGVSSTRDVYIAGETFDTELHVTSPSGKPVEAKLKVEVFEVTESAGETGEKLVQTHEVSSGKEDGAARQTLQLDEGGRYIVRASGTDQFGNNVSGQKRISISGDSDSVRLRILADRHSWDVGEQAKVRVHWRGKPALALVTFEGARILGHQLISLKTGNNVIDVPVDSKLAPNFLLSLAVMERNKFHTANSPFQVAQKLKVTLKPERKELRPGDPLKVVIEVTDANGNPIVAELSVGLVQANLLNMFGDVQGAIDAFFSKGQRIPSLRQSTSCTFAYRPKTSGISAALLAELERRNRLEREVAALNAFGDDVLAFAGPGGPAASTATEESLDEFDDAADMLTGANAGLRFSRRRGQMVEQMQKMAQQGQTLNAGGQLGAFAESGFAGGGFAADQMLGGEMAEGQATAGVFSSGVTRGRQPMVDGPGPGVLNIQDLSLLKSDLFAQNEVTVNGITATGRFLALNGRKDEELEELVNEGLRLLPGMAHSETGFWNPTIVTDDKGVAEIVVTMPTKSTAWKLRTKGINGESLAGQASAEIITKKDLFGEMKLPQAFVAGDTATIPVDIHNSLKGNVSVEVVLKATFDATSTEQKQTVDLTTAGIERLYFPIQIPEASIAKFELSVRHGDLADTSRHAVQLHPWGLPVFATASGTASQSTLEFVNFNKGVVAGNRQLEVVIGPSVNRSLLDAVLGGGQFPIARCGLLPGSSLERAISDVLGGVALLEMIGNTRESDTPDAQALSGKITGAISQLVSSQRDDGSWSWNGDPKKGQPDVYMTSRAMWALSKARKAGFAVPGELLNRGTAYLKTAFSKSRSTELEVQTVILQSLATADAADFALANRLYRERNRLKQSGLLHLAIALNDMNHRDMAVDVLDLVKLPIDKATVHSNTDRAQTIPWLHNSAELRALYFHALQQISPKHPEVNDLAAWLMAARIGSRWPVEKVNGIALLGLAEWHARTRHLSEKYRLTVVVNGEEVEVLNIDPAKDASRRVEIPIGLLSKPGQEQEVEFVLDGRGTFSYSVVLTGFVAADKVKSSTRDLQVTRTWLPALRMLDGKPVPRGFGVVNGSYNGFSNPLTQLPVGELGLVTLHPRRHTADGDYLVLTETIPSGCTVLDGSITGSFERYELEPGRIRFYIGNTRYPGDIHYTLVGYLPGKCRAPQAVLRSFYDPSRMAVSSARDLTVLNAGEKTADKYRLTPDELYHFGQRYLAKGATEEAHKYLLALFTNWRLDNDKYKNVVQWLFRTSLEKDSHEDVVRFFEIIREKFSDVEVSFENILKVAKSYKEMSEYERSYLVYRATIQGNFERESQVTGFLNQRGEFLRSTQILEDLFRDYPGESYVAVATYALAQETYRRAPLAKDDKRLTEQGVTRVHLIDAAIHMLDHFVTAWPSDPASDQASFAIATALIDLDQYQSAIDRCRKYAARFGKSRLLDSFWYIIGYSYFELENHEEALKMCRRVADTRFEIPETGGERSAQNKFEAIYIMGQVYHSLGKAAEAIAEYTVVKEKFADAAEAIKFFSRRSIELDEIVTIKPTDKKEVPLRFRNIPEAAVKVYRIDLMKFGLMQRNLDRITAINLAGIKPYHEQTVKLGDGKDYRDRTHQLNLPLKEEGAYLVVCRGDNLYTSGLVLVSPLTLAVQEDETSGRVRVTVKDTTEDSFLDDVDVKVIGAGNSSFKSGETDLRGLFVADDVKGNSTVIAMADNDRYAFFRGEKALQGWRVQPPATPATVAPQASPKALKLKTGKEALRLNIINQNGAFQREQHSNYGELLNNSRSGIQSFEVDAGGK